MRVILCAALLLAAPVHSFAYITACGFGGSQGSGPATGTAEMIISGTTLHFQNIQFHELFDQAPFTMPHLGVPAVSIIGSDIHITQQYTPPTAPSVGDYAADFCQSEDVNVGVLPPGTYTVVWSYATPAGAVDITRRIHLDPQPCSAAARAWRPVVSVTRTPAGTAHLHVESFATGYAPSFGVPKVVSNSDGLIQIVQPFIDSGYSLPGPPPTATLCHADDIDLGVLPAGAYRLSWNYDAMLGGTASVLRGGLGGSFIWSGSEMQCSSSGVFSTSPAVPVNSGPTTLLFSRTFMGTASDWGQALVSGSQIAVYDEWDTEGHFPPVPPPLTCYTMRIRVPRLQVGGYDVKWMVVNIFGTETALDSFHFNVVQGRRRAAR